MIQLAMLLILGGIKCGNEGGGSKPSIHGLSCPPDSIEYGTAAVFEWTASDPDGEIVGYYYGLDDAPLQTWTTASACTLMSVSVGSHVFLVTAVDNEDKRSDLSYCTFEVGEPGEKCAVSPTSLDFGTVAPGASADLSFTITNNGSAALSGTVGEPCDGYSIVSGGGSYSLSAGQSRTVVVRFEPASCGVHACTVETGNGACSDVSCAGEGGGAACELSATSLDFGTVELGSSEDLTFTLTNTGCATLDGAITESCEEFAVVTGGGPYSLQMGEVLTVVVRFSPQSAGARACAIETGLTGSACSAVGCVGRGGEVPASCGVSPAGLSFGAVAVGASADLSFTITNTGMATLSGTLAKSTGGDCGDFSIVSGAGPYALGPGESLTASVRFTPGSCGPKSCAIETGADACSDVACTGEGGGAGCQVSPSGLDFGQVSVGANAVRSFSITNTGCTVLEGAVSESCAEYSIVSGGGAYLLAAGQVRSVTVRFTPASPGVKTCTVQTGPAGSPCSSVACEGEGLPAGCSVSPTSLSFGPVELGSYTDRSFTITNGGSTTLSGTVSESCGQYSVVSGGGSYSLGAGQSRTVTVRFEPTSCGTKTCKVETGSDACADVDCSGEGRDTRCEVSPAVLDFGTVQEGWTADLSFTIRNVGCTTLTGAVSESCDGYSVVSGGGPYSLIQGQSRTVTVRFSPSSCGTYGCTVETGLEACPSVTCTGEGDRSDCDVSPANFGFGGVEVGSYKDATFTITNNGCRTISSTLTESCAAFSIVSGQSFSIIPGGSHTVTVRFSPGSAGPVTCVIETGNASCPYFICSGTGQVTDCEVLPAVLDFGALTLGSSRDMTFTIYNRGTTTISGTIGATCGDYSIVSGSGAYSIARDESLTVTVRFSPTTCGPHPCTIETGAGACSDVSCTGQGDLVACSVSPASIDMGTVALGESADTTFTITNNGCNPFAGTVSAGCGAYAIISGGGAYTLGSGQSRVVTVRFSPTMCGPHPCTIETGSAICSDVSFTGQGDLVACSVTPASIDMGRVALGESADTTFTITNAGCNPFAGTVSASCGDYEIISGGGAYTLGSGQSRVVTVRFSPTTCGPHPCTIGTGSAICSDVLFTGQGDLVACSVTPASIDMGTVALGESADTTFTITNAGCNPFAGTVSASCGDYEIISGGGAYTLGSGQSRVVTVRFSPTTCGPRPCTIGTGSAICSDVSFTGQGEDFGCSVTPSYIDFGSVPAGSTADTTITVTNTGTCGTISGMISEGCGDFEILSGDGAFTLIPGQGRSITVRFAPASTGAKSCTITLDSPHCSDIVCDGVGS